MKKNVAQIEAIDDARAYLYGFFSLFFTFTYDKGVIDEILDGLNTVVSNPINTQMQRAALRLREKIRDNRDALFDEYDSLFLAPDGDMIRTSASFFTEGLESGKKRLEMIDFLVRTPYRKAKDFTENEDDIGFVFSFMSKIALDGERYKSLQKQVFQNIINVYIDDLLDRIFKSKNSDIFKDVAEMLVPFVEFERLYFEVGKPKKGEEKPEMARVLPYRNLKRRKERSERVEGEACDAGIEDEEPIEDVD